MLCSNASEWCVSTLLVWKKTPPLYLKGNCCLLFGKLTCCTFVICSPHWVCINGSVGQVCVPNHGPAGRDSGEGTQSPGHQVIHWLRRGHGSQHPGQICCRTSAIRESSTSLSDNIIVLETIIILWRACTVIPRRRQIFFFPLKPDKIYHLHC